MLLFAYGSNELKKKTRENKGHAGTQSDRPTIKKKKRSFGRHVKKCGEGRGEGNEGQDMVTQVKKKERENARSGYARTTINQVDRSSIHDDQSSPAHAAKSTV